ncbi:MAG TPA: hypothetical protein VFZ70_06385 [Euzebyales bacterium]
MPAADAEPLDAETAARLADLVAAAWRMFDRVAANAPAKLRKGPGGGGRDRDQIAEHVAESEPPTLASSASATPRSSSLRPAGSRPCATTCSPSCARKGDPLVDKGWPPRYAARRIAWHVFDHAWEIEDKST